LSEVHVQDIWKFYPELLRYCRLRPKPMLMLTVQQNGSFGWRDHADEIIDCYEWLKNDVKNPFGLHVHFPGRRRETSEWISYERQFGLIKYGKDILEEIGILVNDFTSGWSQYDTNTVKACFNADILNFHYRRGREIGLLKGMTGIPYRRFIHDFQITEELLQRLSKPSKRRGMEKRRCCGGD